MTQHKVDKTGLLVFFMAFLQPLLRTGVAPSWGGDAADMVAAFSLLASQDSAYPLSTKIQHLWCLLPLGNIPFRLLLLGSLLLGATSWCGYQIAKQLFHLSESVKTPRKSIGQIRFLLWMPLLVAVGLLHSSGSLSVSATFQVWLCLLLILQLLRLQTRLQEGSSLRSVGGVAFLAGLTCINHPPSFLWLSPCFVWLLLRLRGQFSFPWHRWVLPLVLFSSSFVLLTFHHRPHTPLLRKIENVHEASSTQLKTRRRLSLNPMLRLHRSLSHRGSSSFVWLYWLLMLVGGISLTYYRREAGGALLFLLLGAIALGMWSPYALHSDISALLCAIVGASLVSFSLLLMGQRLLERFQHHSPNTPFRRSLLTLLLGLLVLPLLVPELWFNWRKKGASYSWQPLLWSEVVEEPLPRGALLVAHSRELYTLRLYRRLVEGQRPDLMIVLPYKTPSQRGPQSGKARKISNALPQLTTRNVSLFLKKLKQQARTQPVCIEWFREFPSSMTRYLHPIGGLFRWLPDKQVKLDKYGQAENDRSFAAQQNYFWQQAYKALELSDETGRGDLRQWLLKIHLSHARVYFHSHRWLSGLQEIQRAQRLAPALKEVQEWKKKLQKGMEQSTKLRQRARIAIPTKIP